MHIKDLLQDYEDFSNKVLYKMDNEYQMKDEIYIEKSIKDIWYSLLFIKESVVMKEPQIISEYFKWLKVIFDSLDFSPDTTVNLFTFMKEELLLILDDEEAEFLKDVYLDLEEKPGVIDNPFQNECDTYVDLILSHDRNGAQEYVLGLLNENISVKDIYINVFQAAMYKIGELWQAREISVADEHYATIVTQLNITMMYPSIFGGAKSGKRLLATAIGSELHEMGIRMVADMFELQGWNTVYLGSNIPVGEVLKFIDDFKPDLIALSVTMSIHLSQLKDAIEKIKEIYPNIKIIVGGRPFIENVELYKKVLADGSAIDGHEAVALGEKLIG